VNDRMRQAAVHGAGVLLEVGPGETVDALVTRCVQCLWSGLIASACWPRWHRLTAAVSLGLLGPASPCAVGVLALH
jgi:hypothetical protein